MKAFKKTKSLVAVGPYSLAREVGNTLYCSGQIGINEKMELVSGGVEEEYNKIISNTKELLTKAGYKLNDIVKVGIFLRNTSDFTRINKMYKRTFSEPYPSRTTIGGVDIPLNANIKIEITAVKNK
jgi:2-iminobutanoate/2-iminopropanoate deaminase